MNSREKVHARANALTRWLLETALPLWSTNGQDERGGFYDELDLTGKPVATERRCYVSARQLYVYSKATRLGWASTAEADHAYHFLISRFRRPDGLFARACEQGSGSVDPAFDLYDQAFVVFALATAAKPPLSVREAEGLAREILLGLRERWAHPMGGFEEGNPRILPLRANPHMHLLEAALEWTTVKGAEVGPWAALADELVQLCVARMIDPSTGALHEFFDGEWRFAPGDTGRIVEPGHQFEWAWLLDRWASWRERPDVAAIARKMCFLAEEKGIERGGAINELWDDLTVKDGGSPLWPQTERIKAWSRLAAEERTAPEQERSLDRVLAAIDGLEVFLKTPIPGLWYKQRDALGHYLAEPSPARLLYHIVCAIESLVELDIRLSTAKCNPTPPVE
jgi:mannose/cellobiose epimerase-like protein (N-acyl-D-glucosamine 2-epimerase family)